MRAAPSVIAVAPSAPNISALPYGITLTVDLLLAFFCGLFAVLRDARRNIHQGCEAGGRARLRASRTKKMTRPSDISAPLPRLKRELMDWPKRKHLRKAAEIAQAHDLYAFIAQTMRMR
jgi:hypothetical protein